MQLLNYQTMGHPITGFRLYEPVLTWDRKKARKANTRREYERTLKKANKEPKRGFYETN